MKLTVSLERDGRSETPSFNSNCDHVFGVPDIHWAMLLEIRAKINITAAS